MSDKRIILLGAGYANLSVLKALNKSTYEQAEITLINKNPYHYHSILLHKVASDEGLKGVTFELPKILNPKVIFKEEEILSIEKNKIVTNKSIYEDFDYLCLGMGFEKNTFGIKGMEEYAGDIGSYELALKVRDRIYAHVNNKDATKEDLSFIICGGGLTGVELAGSLAVTLRDRHEEVFKKSTIYLVEALPNILPMLSTKLIDLARKHLADLGVKVLENSKITECIEGGIKIEKDGVEETIKGNTTIWTAGVQGSHLIAKSNFTQARNKIEVDNNMHPINEEDKSRYFVLGDVSALKNSSGNGFHAPTAQLAIAQGTHVGRMLNAKVKGKSHSEQFNFNGSNTVCSIGKGYAIGSVGGREFSGYLGHLVKMAVEKKWEFTLKRLK